MKNDPHSLLRRYAGVVCLALGLCSGAAMASPQSFFKHGEEGWFWYQELPEPEEAEPADEPAPLPTPAAAPAPATQQQAAVAEAGPPMFSVAWLNEQIPVYRDRAIDNPTQENIQAFMYLQRVMMDKSQRFADAAQVAVINEPALDELGRAPLTSFAATHRTRETTQRQFDLMNQLATQAGLFFIYDSTCSYCEIQAPVLELFAREHGFTVYAVAADNRPMPNGHFPDFKPNNGIVQALGVERYPAIFLAVPPDTYVTLSQGAISAQDLRDRVEQGAVQAGLITEDQRRETRMLASMPAVEDITTAEQQALEQDPAAITRMLRNRLRTQQ